MKVRNVVDHEGEVLYRCDTSGDDCTIGQLFREYAYENQNKFCYMQAINTADVLEYFDITNTKTNDPLGVNFYKFIGVAELMSERGVDFLTSVGYKADRKKKSVKNLIFDSLLEYQEFKHMPKHMVYTNTPVDIAYKAVAASKYAEWSMNGTHDENIDVEVFKNSLPELYNITEEILDVTKAEGREINNWRTEVILPLDEELIKRVELDKEKIIELFAHKHSPSFRKWVKKEDEKRGV